MTFAAIDFETANQHPSSICSIGIVIVHNNIITDRLYTLVNPEPDFYAHWCTRIHGLTAEDTCNAPNFQAAWQQLELKIRQLPLFAHNSRFDESCLKAAFKVYGMDYPDYRFYDTLRASRQAFGYSLPNHQLQTVAAARNHDFKKHHNALADAEACAAIAIYLEDYFDL